MNHLRDQPSTCVESELRARIALLEREHLEKDRKINRIHLEKRQLEEDLAKEKRDNFTHTAHIRSLQDNSLLNRNASEKLKNSLNGLKEGIAQLYEEVEHKQVRLPTFGQNNEEERALQKFVNYVLREIENLNSLVRTDDIDGDH